MVSIRKMIMLRATNVTLKVIKKSNRWKIYDLDISINQYY